jgi:asparagine synthase (glutamine-hydrolysing)
MCGVVGIVDSRFVSSGRGPQDAVARMRDTLIHRGPNDSGVWVDSSNGVALAHTRLSVLDLSQAGHQPMVSGCMRYVIAFNGEIYNHREIRLSIDKLDSGSEWRGHSDTEILLAAVARWGIRSALERFNGMFAFALWDRKTSTLYLARDRLGEKPLYYGYVGGAFLFGSELKALRAHPRWQGIVDRRALALYLRHSYVPAPYSIYEGVFKLGPGMLLKLKVAKYQGSGSGSEPTIEPYWAAAQFAEKPVSEPFCCSENEAVGELDEILRSAVGLRMGADVPVGAFLSGGIDSSTVAALMQVQSDRPIRTFTIGFHEKDYDEACHARRVAQHLGTEHTELYITPDDAMSVIPRLATVYDEPFADSSQIPMVLISELTRRHVAVSLAGDGGDELFAGYSRYFWASNVWARIGWMPQQLRRRLQQGLLAVTPAMWDQCLNSVRGLWSGQQLAQLTGDRLHKVARLLDAESFETMYQRLISHWMRPERIVKGADDEVVARSDVRHDLKSLGNMEWMMFYDVLTYLPDDLLVKVDRASMAVSLEARLPLLDHRVVELAWRMPMSMKVREGKGKWLLRQVLNRYVPSELVERPKMGFAIPMGSWLRGPLRDWAENLLDARKLHCDGYFDPTSIRRKWGQHLAGDRNWEYCLWDVLMFQAWLLSQ